MKTVLVALTFLGAALTAAAYQAGPQNRTNFGASQQQPAQAGRQNYRSFSNYNRNWGQGVQTQRVQTEVAGKSATDFENKQKTVGKTQAVAPKAAKSAPQAVPTPPSSAPAAMPANMDPSAMMQQVQGMMNAMGNMGGAQPTQPGAAGQAQTSQNAAVPDISALMGGALPTPLAPAAAPAKK